MKRIIIIGWAALLAASPSFSQLGPLRGEIGYEHQYQDVLVNGSLLTSLRRSPSLTLSTTGSVTSPNFLFYTLRTSLVAGFLTSNSSQSSVTTRNILWNAYNVNVFFLQTAPVNFQVASREYLSDTRYDYQGLRSRGGTRDHEDRLSLSLARVPFLPLVNFSFVRNKSWSVVGEPFDQRTHQYILSASTRNGTDGHASVTGTLSSFSERYSGFSERILSVQFDGSRAFAEDHHLTIGSEYNRYASYSAIAGGASYAGRISEQVQLNTGVSAQNASSANYALQTVGASQSVQVTMSRRIRWGIGVGGATGTAVLQRGGSRERVPNNQWNANLNLTHTSMGGPVGLVNNLALSYGEREYFESLSWYRIGLTNSANATAGRFLLNASYNFSHLENYNSGSWRSTEHLAMLAVTGTFPPSIRSRSTADFRSYDYGGDRLTASDQRSLNLSQSFDASFRHVIPYSLGAGGSAHFFFTGLRGRSHGWHASFQSPRFFLQNLHASYRYTRNYDPYYRKATTEHSARFSYRWRLISFQLSLAERTVFSRLRDVRFAVERTL